MLCLYVHQSFFIIHEYYHKSLGAVIMKTAEKSRLHWPCRVHFNICCYIRLRFQKSRISSTI